MPELVINTNISRAKVTAEILKELSTALTNTIGKPEQYCTVRVVPDQLMLFGGTDAPCATATFMSIGKLGVAENKKHSAAIASAATNLLGIPNDRMYITFTDKPSSEVGFKGTTFHDILR